MVGEVICLLCLREGKTLVRQPDPTAQRGHGVRLEEGAIKDLEANGEWGKNTRGTCQGNTAAD